MVIRYGYQMEDVMRKIGSLTFTAQPAQMVDGRAFGWKIEARGSTRNANREGRRAVRRNLDRLGIGNNDFDTEQAALAALDQFSR